MKWANWKEVRRERWSWGAHSYCDRLFFSSFVSCLMLPVAREKKWKHEEKLHWKRATMKIAHLHVSLGTWLPLCMNHMRNVEEFKFYRRKNHIFSIWQQWQSYSSHWSKSSRHFRINKHESYKQRESLSMRESDVKKKISEKYTRRQQCQPKRDYPIKSVMTALNSFNQCDNFVDSFFYSRIEWEEKK